MLGDTFICEAAYYGGLYHLRYNPMPTDVSEEHIVSICTVGQLTKQEISMKQAEKKTGCFLRCFSTG
jgi:hypothetical protein